MSLVETHRAQLLAARARIAAAGANPKITKVKPATVDCPIRPYTLAMLTKPPVVKRPIPRTRYWPNAQDELAWAIEIEGAEGPKHDVAVRRIQRASADHFGVDIDELLSDKRAPLMVDARHLAAYICRQLTTRSFPELGVCFRKDHSTLIHGVRRVERLIENEPLWRASADMLIEQLRDNQ